MSDIGVAAAVENSILSAPAVMASSTAALTVSFKLDTKRTKPPYSRLPAPELEV
jgi:hypothetical protein